MARFTIYLTPTAKITTIMLTRNISQQCNTLNLYSTKTESTSKVPLLPNICQNIVDLINDDTDL